MRVVIARSAATKQSPGMNTTASPRFHYRLGVNQPAHSPTARRLAEMAEAIGRDTDGEFRLDAFQHCWLNGFHPITTSNRPIREAADFAGLKIRTPGGELAADFFRTLGAEPGMVPFSGMYDALKAKTFDGQSDPLGVVQSLRLDEVQGYLSLTGHWGSGFNLLAHGAAWQALPRDIQTVVERSAEGFAKLQRQDVEAINHAGETELARRGMIVNHA